MPGSTGGGWKRSDLATVTGVAQPTGKPAEDRPQALPSGTATAPALDPTNLPCVLCHQPTIMQSPRGKPCHWTCAMAWTNEREDQAHAEARAASALRAGAAAW